MEAPEDGVRAMLLPMVRGGFTVLSILVPPQPESRAGRDMALIRLTRLAHELGHSFFYAPGAPPRRLFPIGPEEERFCDAFAAALGRTRSRIPLPQIA